MKPKSYDNLFNKFTKNNHIHEFGLLIENGRGEIIFSKTYGEKSLDTPIVAASITKMITASCVIILVQNGYLDLNDELSKFYDSSFLKGLHLYKGKDYSSELRISDLLYQTSGLPDIYEDGENSIKKQAISSDISLSFTESIALTKKMDSRFPPDKNVSAYYSDINYDILGDIVERVSQSPLEKVFEENVFSKVGMKNTYLPISEHEYIPKIYYNDECLYRPKFIISSRASGGCITTIHDLMKFIKAFFKGELFEKRIFDKLKNYRKLQLSMFPLQYGGGFMRVKIGGLSTLFIGKGDLIGHSGSTGSFAFYYPYRDMFYVGDFNQSKYPALPIRCVMKLAMYS